MNSLPKLSNLMRYLDKVYRIGKPQLFFMNTGEELKIDKSAELSKGIGLSDDAIIDLNGIGRELGESNEKLIADTYYRVWSNLMVVRFNLLVMLCSAHKSGNPIIIHKIAESIFNDVQICELVEMYRNEATKLL